MLRRNEHAPLLADPDGAPRTQTVTIQTSLGHVGATLSDDLEMGSVVVRHVHPTDLAARSGLRPGDCVLSLNDVPVSNHEHAVKLIDEVRATDGGGLLTVTFIPAADAEAERARKRGAGDEAAARRSRRWGAAGWVAAALLLLHVFFGGGGEQQHLSPEQIRSLQSMAIHQAQDELVAQLNLTAANAARLGSDAEMVRRLGRQPLLLINAVRAAMMLNHFVNITYHPATQAQLGLDTPEPPTDAPGQGAEGAGGGPRAYPRAGGG